MDAVVEAIEEHLERHFSCADQLSPELTEASRFAVLSGGKRIRGSLVCATVLAFDGSMSVAVQPGAAVECLHAYSLVHDDLPSMDNSPTRRGKPSCHVKYGEAMAILAGDGLQSLAFELLANAPNIDAETRVQLVQELAGGAGNHGMVGGQAMDIQSPEDSSFDVVTLERLHAAKTGKLIVAAVRIGALVAGLSQDDQRLQNLSGFAKRLGQAFQIVDDLLDSTSDSSVTGKPTSQDSAQNKLTYPAILGIEGSRQRAQELLKEAVDLLSRCECKDGWLRTLAERCVDRVN